MIRMPTSIDWPRSVRAFALSFACVATFATVQALAEPTAAERSLAAALFDQGRTLMSEGKLDEACVKLAESQRLDPGGGTLLNLALCHEKQGKIATAWTEFREARAMAKKDNRPDREGAADTAIAKLEPMLSKISVIVSADAKVAGMSVEIDGLPLPEAAWGTPFPVDPGTRNVVVKAPGYREWRSTVEIGKTAGVANVNVPKLEKAGAGGASPVPSTSSSATKPPPAASSGSNTTEPPKSVPDAPMHPTRKTGFILGGVGLAFIGIGSIAGSVAISKDGEADEACEKPMTCDADAVALSKEAVTLAHVSTATFAIGLAGVALGTVLVVIAPKTAPANVSLSVGPQFVSVTTKF